MIQKYAHSECLTADAVQQLQAIELVIGQSSCSSSVEELLSELVLHVRMLRKQLENARQCVGGCVHRCKDQNTANTSSINNGGMTLYLKGWTYDIW